MCIFQKLQQLITDKTGQIKNKSASRPPVFLLVMLGYSATIPETEKTTVLCEACLHAHKKTNDLIYSDS